MIISVTFQMIVVNISESSIPTILMVLNQYSDIKKY